MYHVYHLMSFELLVMKVDLVTGGRKSGGDELFVSYGWVLKLPLQG